MARYDETTGHGNGLYSDAVTGADDSWPDAPDPAWLSDDARDDVGEDPGDDPGDYDDLSSTQSIPTFDLGSGTESVVVDLTAPLPTVTPPPLASPSEDALPGGDAMSYDHEAPVADLPPPPEPANSRHAAPMGSYVEHSAPEPPEEWNIPPVPAASSRADAESLTAASVLRTRRARPQSGWRKHVLTLTGGKVNLGLSPEDRRRADLLARARTPVRGSHRVAVISLKGGVGKTTTTAALGSMFANLRGDRVIAVDANPDRGTLSERITRESGATIRHLLEARERVTRYGDVRAFTSQSPTRLEVLASDSDPGASSALSEQDYIDTLDTLERFYNLVLTDCGTGLLHDAMRGVLGLASSLVVVSSASLDGARSASATLDWLEAHGLDDLARNAVVVISSVRPGGGIVDVLQLEDHFASRCRAVVTIPYDPHLEAGSALDLDELDEETLEAYQELAAVVGEGFALASRSS